MYANYYLNADYQKHHRYLCVCTDAARIKSDLDSPLQTAFTFPSRECQSFCRFTATHSSISNITCCRCFRKNNGGKSNEVKYFAAAQNFMHEQAPNHRRLRLALKKGKSISNKVLNHPAHYVHPGQLKMNLCNNEVMEDFATSSLLRLQSEHTAVNANLVAPSTCPAAGTTA